MDLKLQMESLKQIILMLDDCIDDYLFVLDLEEDVYTLSPHALKRFKIENYHIKKPLNGGIKSFVYDQDYATLIHDLHNIIYGDKEYHDMQYRWIGKDGVPIWVNCRGKSIKDENGKIKYFIGCINEIGKKQVADNASGLLGEMSFKNLILPIQDKLHKGFMLRLGLDDFKSINESLGVKYGDYILKQTAECIKHLIDEKTFFYKIVGDEYIIFNFEKNIDDAIKLYASIKEEIENYIESINFEVHFTISAGILDFYTNSTASYTEMMKWTEFALNCSKQLGKNTYTVFNQRDYRAFQRKTDIIQDIRYSIVHDFKGFWVEFQPIICQTDQRMYSMESLLRFECDAYGIISPNELIPVLEETDLIIPVGKWILEKAMEALALLKPYVPELKVHVNFSYVQVLKTNLLKDILSVVNRYEVEKKQLVVELTESGFIDSDRNFKYFCSQLKENGISLALDDFGTGYSNFHYLYNLKPEFIKIDRGLMKNALSNEYENMLLKHMVEMAHSVNVKMCIEGIETQKEYDAITKLNPDFIQGYYYSKPCKLDDIVENVNNSL